MGNRECGRGKGKGMGKCKDLFKRGVGRPAFRFVAVLVPVFVLIAALNFMTPYTVDDFCYMFSFADFNQRITYIGQIFASMASHYQSVNGRVIPHFLVQIFLMEGMDKAFFNIVNTLVFLALGAEIFFFANVGKERRTPARLLGIYLILFTFIPVFGQTCLWLDGAVNYLWGVSADLLVLIFFQYAFLGKAIGKNHQVVATFFVSILAFVCGSWNENTSAAVVAVMAAYLILSWILKKKTYLFMYTSFVSATAGWLIMITAPANFVRIDSQDSTFFENLPERLTQATLMFRMYAVPFFVMLFILMMLALLIQTGKVSFLKNVVFEGSLDQYLLTGVFMAASIAANYAMVMVPFYADRSALGVCVFSAASVCIFASCFKVKKNNWFTVGTGALLTAGVLALALSILPGMADFGRAGEIRQESILAAYENGAEAVEIDIIVPQSRYMSSYGLLDFRPGTEEHVNDVTRQRMGLDIIGRKKWVECKISTIEKVKNRAMELLFE